MYMRLRCILHRLGIRYSPSTEMMDLGAELGKLAEQIIEGNN